MAQQRYAFALGLIKEQGARTVLDIGCGEGRLLEHLLTQVLHNVFLSIFPQNMRYMSPVTEELAVVITDDLSEQKQGSERRHACMPGSSGGEHHRLGLLCRGCAQGREENQECIGEHFP